MSAAGSDRGSANVGQVFRQAAIAAYRVALLAYPARFRRELGAQMSEAFADRCSAAGAYGPLRFLRLVTTGLLDAVVNGIGERLGWGARRPESRFPKPRSPRRGYTMSLLFDDIKRVTRRLRRAPAFTISVVLTIAVGIGAFVSIFGVVDSVLWEAAPYPDPERLVYVWRDYTWMSFPRGWAGGIDVLAIRDGADAFESVATIRAGSFNLSSRDGGEPEEIRALMTSANFFDTLGVQPLLGRGFLPGEDIPEATRVVVLDHGVWQQRYGADPDIIGTSIYLDDVPVEVVGVMPEWFRFAQHASLSSPVTGDLFVNYTQDLSQIIGGALSALARLRDGVSIEVAQAQLDAVVEPIDREIFGERGLRLWAAPLHEDLVREVRPALLAIIGAALFLLLILGVNLATLLLGRANRRHRELALCAAVGAGRGSLLRESLLESMMLALSGGAIGLLMARWGTAALADAAATELPLREGVAADGSVVLAAVVAAAALGLLAGLAPAARAARTNVADALRRSGAGMGPGRAPDALVVAQVAISLTLLVGAGSLARSFVYMLRAEPGFDPRGVLTFRVPLTNERTPDAAAVNAFYNDLRLRLAGVAGVEAVGGASSLPLTADASQAGIRLPGAPGNTGVPDADTPLVDYLSATPGYFETLRIPILAGRAFRESDDAEAAPVVIIDDLLARRFFPNDDPLGHVVQFFEQERTIVGVIDQPRHYNVHSDDRYQIYLPYAQRVSSMYFTVRAGDERDPLSLAPAVRDVVRSIYADQPLSSVRTMEQITDESMSGERLSLTMIGGFALAALLLATLGLYGVISNTVTSRTREMGVRLALGARPGRLRRMVVGQGMRLTVIGAVLGLAGALATTQFLEGMLVGVEPTDPVTLFGVTLGLGAVTALACYLPARRAASIDPMVSLRAD